MRTLAFGLVLLFALLPAAHAQDDGLYADFSTSMGAFTCRLDFTNAPKAVANFVGLATGTRPWLDDATGLIYTNGFYNGLTFHRVIQNFMIQGGSPNGQGTDGPGYVFPDEFTPLLRHDGPGVLSMANSGRNSNGAQFFITVTNTSWLNDVHTIFGHVTTGQAVVDAISQVATDSTNHPLVDVTIQGVTIRRVGAAAEGFDISAQALPVVTGAQMGITGGTGTVFFAFSNTLYTKTVFSISTNLKSWTAASLGVDTQPPVSTSAWQSTTVPVRFYAVSQVKYPSSTFAPRSLSNRALTLAFSGGATLPIQFNATGGGSYTFGGTPGTVTSYTWQQDIYRGKIWPIYYSTLPPMTLKMDFTNNGVGLFSGTRYTNATSYAVSGTFTLSPP